MDKFKDLDNQALATLRTEKRTEFDALVALEAPTAEQLAQAEALADEIDEIKAEVVRREAEASEQAERFSRLKERFASEDEDPREGEEPREGEGEDEEPREEADPTQPGDGEDTNNDARQEPQGDVKARGKGVQRLARKTPRPPAPARARGTVSLTAAADVPGFPASSSISDLSQLSEAVVNRTRGFAPPSGSGEGENWQRFGVASLHLPFEDDLVIDRGTDDMEVLERASRESRLDGGSLTAAGGWCAPSETIYDLAGDETTEGMVSLPEVAVRRGGIRYTFGPDFSDFYANAGFIQTEAEAIAGATKPCVTIDCPAFQEVRLDAVGLCLRIPILTNAAYPELIQRYTSGTMVAHQHMVNAEVISRMVTLAGAARTVPGLGSTAHDTLTGLELIANQRRQQYRLSFNATLEVVLPFWVKSAIRGDLGIRTGQAVESVTDEQINAHFRNRRLNVQWVYDWQDLPTVDDAGTTTVDEANTYPTTFDALMYPAGTFIKGTADIINLSAVYDSASLQTNIYTGLFMEQGILVAHMKAQADLVTLPVCNAGRTGAADLTC